MIHYFYAKSNIDIQHHVFVIVIDKKIPKYDRYTCLEDGTPIVWVDVSIFPKVLPPRNLIEVSPPSEINVAISNMSSMFRFHSNLISITAEFDRNEWVICFGVIAKGFIPLHESLLPKKLNGFHCIVRNGKWRKCMINDPEQSFNPLLEARPLRPGVAICPQPFLHFSETPTCATLGGFVYFQDKWYGLTAAHLFSNTKPPGGNFMNIGTLISQPCAFTKLLSFIEDDPFGRLDKSIIEKHLLLLKWFRANVKDKDIEEFNQENTSFFGSLKEFHFLETTEENQTIESFDIALMEINDGIDVNPEIPRNINFEEFDGMNISINRSGGVYDNCWTQDEFRNSFPNRITCYSYGCRSHQTTGIVESYTSNLFKQTVLNYENNGYTSYFYKDCICVLNTTLDAGDSGSFVWTREGETAKLLGLIQSHYYIGERNFAMIIPIWKILAWLEQVLDNEVK